MKLLKTNFSGLSQSLGAISFPKFLFFLLLTILFFNPGREGLCAQITLTWDPNSETDLAGYDIYYGTSSGNYQSKTDVGNVTTYTVNGLSVGVTYYLAATAYNTQGLQSGYSNEVVYTVPSCTYTISPSSASFSTSGGSGSVLVTTQAGCNWGSSTAPSWITVNSGSGTGGGTMTYTISPNTGTTRTASLTIAGNVFTINEAGLAAYTITASATTGGSISPSGKVSVAKGAGQTFTIAANTGYKIAGVTVDGVSKGAIASYTFSAVNANHTIAASFTPLTYSLSVTKNGTGSGSVSVTPTGTTFPAGTQVTLTAAPDSNSLFSGWSGGCSGTATTCQGTMNSNVSVTATFTIKTNTTYTITASAGAGGSISPSGQISVQQGAGKTFTITPNSGYVIADVKADGVSKGAISSYTFSAVNANHTITASFSLISSGTYSLSISKNGTGNGTVSTNPSGTTFPAGTGVTLNAAPGSNSVFSGWSGACSGTSSTCQVTMNSNLNVTATFSAVTKAPVVSTGSVSSVTYNSATLNGTVNPNGLSTTYFFQWGRTTSYGSATAATSAGSGTGVVAASVRITGLRYHAVYHYRLVATNSAGTSYGADQSFRQQKPD